MSKQQLKLAKAATNQKKVTEVEFSADAKKETSN